MSHHQNHNLMITDISFENVVEFKYERTPTNKNYIHKEIKSRLNLVLAMIPFSLQTQFLQNRKSELSQL